MAKVTIPDLTASYASVTKLNEYFQQLEDELNNNVLYRDNPSGEPNAMSNDIDMDSNDILNANNIDAISISVDGTDIATKIQEAETAASEAEASATAAATSAAQAATSAGSASDSEANAAQSAINAEDAVPEWRGGWTTATFYEYNELAREDGSTYICLADHTSGTFSTDLGAGKWEIFAAKGISGSGSGDLLSTNNLSDVADASASRANLGLIIGTHVEPADATIVKDADIGVTVQGYDAATAKTDIATNFTAGLQAGGSDVVVDTDIGTTVQAYDVNTTKNDVANTFTQEQTITIPGSNSIHTLNAETGQNSSYRFEENGVIQARLLQQSSTGDFKIFKYTADGTTVKSTVVMDTSGNVTVTGDGSLTWNGNEVLTTASPVGGGLELIHEDQPLSDVSNMSWTGLSAYETVVITGGLQLTSTASFEIDVRASGGTWRTLGIFATTPSGSDRLGFECTINRFNVSGWKKAYGRGGNSTNQFDSTNNLNSITVDFFVDVTATYTEVWDEIRVIPTSGSIEGSSSANRGKVWIYGA